MGHRVHVWAPGSTLPVARLHASTTSLLGIWKTFFFHAIDSTPLPIVLLTIWRVFRASSRCLSASEETRGRGRCRMESVGAANGALADAHHAPGRGTSQVRMRRKHRPH
ncbi:hypothetical protein PPROV_000737000 [Pycnococcus provasolii]|uniref:Uncharacterized protein n=1 Tax=Pycnococcus provasolii TaxID=41880 RepID=A0A830HPH4_9CHLO|nr:hypothetical protein PPROV_000737000 [Pycnococcus provasolii]